MDPQQLSTNATEWGKQHEQVALKAYVDHQLSVGRTGVRASPDAYVNDPTSSDQFGLAEIKCPYEYRNLSPEDAAMNSDFCCSLSVERVKVLLLKHTHNYYS